MQFLEPRTWIQIKNEGLYYIVFETPEFRIQNDLCQY